jgi:hypothetical protein
MIDTVWNLLQQRELRDLNSKLSNVKTQDGVARDTAFRVEDRVDKLTLI